MPKKKIYYLCNYVESNLKTDFYHAESSLKKISSLIKILKTQNIELQPLTLASPKHSKFNLSESPLITPLYLLIRVIYESIRLIKYVLIIYINRHKFLAVMSYSYTTQNVILCVIIYYLFRIKIILDYEDGLILHNTRSWYYIILERIMLTISKGVLLVNKSLSDRLGNNANYTVVNGGFNILNNCVYPNYTKNEGYISLLYTGEISKSYGLKMMIEFFKINKDIRFDLTGNGEDVDYLLNKIRKHKLKHVHFHGYVTHEKLKSLEENSTALFLFQNEDSIFNNTNFPSKLFHYISLYKPVFINKCDMFEGYEKFENVYIVDPKCSIDPVMTNMHNIDIDYKNVLRQMNSYNTNIGNKINNMIKDLHEY